MAKNSYRFAVRLTKSDRKTRKHDKVYAVCDSYQEAFEVCDLLNARGECAWVDTVSR